MRFRAIALGVVSLFLLFERTAVRAQPAGGPDKTPFPDFGANNFPAGSNTQPFVLSQDYPTTLPDASLKPKFLGTDYRQDWYGYMIQARDYCLEGNEENDWVVQKNIKRKWYHMPWQHWGLNGREGLHGLTKEAQVMPQQLSVSQTIANGQTYAVGIFNEFGGYGIGEVWNDHMNPSLEKFNANGGFPEGTVVCKALFVDTPVNQVSYLSSPLQWSAYITQGYSAFRRSVQSVSLIQMDIAVKDPRAPTKWLFGTFIYNGQLLNSNRWKNLVPVGLMWGNDPQVKGDQYTNPAPSATMINPELSETVINTQRVHGALELPPTHLGWNGRLDGPVDNPNSSCMSCHMTAEYPQVSQMNPTFYSQPPARGGPQWMRWFQNTLCNTPFDQGPPAPGDVAPRSADFSMQLAISLQNFDTWKASQDGEAAADDAPAPPSPPGNVGPAPPPPAGVIVTPVIPGAKHKRKVYPIVRDER